MQQPVNLIKRDYEGPKIWVKEFRIYDDKRSAEPIRTIKLKTGLNIIWGDPGEDDTEQQNQLTGSGHAVGKTLFCRFLRYALGETQFGSPEEQGSIRAKFPDPFILAEIVIKGQSWLVKRPLEPVGGHACSQASLAQYDDNEFKINWNHFNEFLSYLNNICLEDLNGETQLDGFSEQLSWQQILPWLSRDQECRLDHLTSWRRAKVTDRQVDFSTAVIRASLNLTSQELNQAVAEHNHKKSENRQNKNELEQCKWNYNYLSQQLNDMLKQSTVAELKDCQTWGDLDRSKLERSIERMLSQYDVDLDSVEQCLWDEYADICEEFTSQFSAQQARRKKIEEEIEFLQGELDRVSKGKSLSAVKRERPVSPLRCNMWIQDAAKKGCTCWKDILQGDDFKEDMTIDELIAVICQNIRLAISKKEEELSTPDTKIASLKQQQKIAANLYRTNLSAFRESRKAQLDEIDFLKLIDAQLQTVARLSQSKIDLAISIQECDAEIFKLNKKCEALRELALRSKLNLQQTFYQLIRSAINNEYEYELVLDKQHIKIALKNHNSEAMNVASILIFDCACLLYSLMTPTALPGLLIHDSPREADLSAGIFNNILTCLPRCLNEHITTELMPYQYVVTTTTKPKDSLMPYVNELVLRANKPQDRLLKCDF